MNLEERVVSMIQASGTRVFMDAIAEYDAHENRYGAWLLTFGLIETFRIVKGIPKDDNTF